LKVITSIDIGLIKKIASIFLALILILSTLGVFVFKHTCTLFDQTETSFFHDKECCERNADKNTTVDIPCCSVEVSQFKISIASITMEPPASIKAIVQVSSFITIDTPVSFEISSKQPWCLQTPPLLDQDRNALLQIYLI
jgi:hypothetical protein